MTKNITAIIRPNERYTEISSGDMTRIAGVAKETSNSQNIHLAIAEIPPGKSSSPHLHLNCESAIYVLAGEGVFVAGKKLSFLPEICIIFGNFALVNGFSISQNS